MKRSSVLGLVAIGFLLTGCSELTSEVDSAVNGVNQATDRISVCTQALGLADINVNADPQQVQQEAGQKAEELRALGNQVTDGNLKDPLFAMADSYVELQQKSTDALGNLSNWIQQKAANLDRLRQACL